MIGSAGRFGRNGNRRYFDDERREPTILTAIAGLLFLFMAAGCFYLFALGMADEFGEVRERAPFEISAAKSDRVVSSGHGYWERKAERREGRRGR